MFRNNRYGGFLTAALVLIVLALISFAAFQMGVASGANVDAGALESGRLGYTGRGFFFFPFFFGFGLLKFVFWLFLFMLVFRLIFRPWGRRAHAGKWGKFKEERMAHMKEMHDQWHADHPDADHPAEDQPTEE